ncbi:MAG: GNAT family N-acetyltransferase [Cyclobacteriaceae bacterium]|nr:GNAT family N-acetyltransferase [Cyclobacteriaceae bacterium]
MIIRAAIPSDGPAIQRLLEQLGYPDLSLEDTLRNLGNHQQADYHVLVGEMEGHVAAFIALHCFHLMHWKEKMGRISAFCVEEGFRSKGLGRQVLHAGEEWFRARGCAKIEVTSNARRIRAHQFYLNLGYIEDSRRFVKYLKPPHA